MKIRIRRGCIEETLLLVLFGFYVLIAHWIWFGRGIQETAMIVLSILVLLKSAKIRQISVNTLPDYILVGILLVACGIGIFQARTRQYLVADLKSMLGTVIVSMAVIASIKRLIASGCDVIEFLFVFLNRYFVLNDILIVIQSVIPYFLMNRKAIASVNNRAYFDQLTGFLGINGTTRWDIWSIAIIILNFYVAYKRNDNRIIKYNIFFFLASIIICMINSARSFLIIAPVTVLIYLFLIRKVEFSNRMKQIFAVFGVLIVALIIYSSNRYVNDYVNDLINDKFAIYLSGDVEHMVAANDDRAVATYYAVENCGTFGVGIGAVSMHSTNNQVKYLGLNSASSYIYMLGVAGYFLWTLCLARIGIDSDKGSIKKTLLYFVYLLLLSYFLPIYSAIALFPVIMFIFYIFDLEQVQEGSER